MSGVTVGAITAILSAVFNGSFAAVSKIPAVAKHDLDPMLFMCYFTVGTTLTFTFMVCICRASCCGCCTLCGLRLHLSPVAGLSPRLLFARNNGHCTSFVI